MSINFLIGALVVLSVLCLIMSFCIRNMKKRIDDLCIRTSDLEDKLDILDDRTIQAINNADFANNRTIMLAQYIKAEFYTEKEQHIPEKTGIRKIKKADENKAK